ncbi:MAG: DUF111 family protein [Anaerolineae bacterium]|jgi:uncharacterized protein (DUF111 family)|nr:DUF111 family protein [Anaerolineae bacterium]MDH7472816.1 DUF111 family protein [Anaerolineae bacterium]
MLVMVNVDNVVGEAVPYVIEKLMGLGAESVHAIPAITKKGRPGFIFLIDTARENVEAIGDFLVREISTLGLRLFEEAEHIKFDSEMKKVRLALQDKELSLALHVKVVRDSQGLAASAKAEYEELRAAVNALADAGVGISLTALKELVETAVLSGEGKVYQGLSVDLE